MSLCVFKSNGTIDRGVGDGEALRTLQNYPSVSSPTVNRAWRTIPSLNCDTALRRSLFGRLEPFVELRFPLKEYTLWSEHKSLNTGHRLPGL